MEKFLIFWKNQATHKTAYLSAENPSIQCVKGKKNSSKKHVAHGEEKSVKFIDDSKKKKWNSFIA